MSARRMKNNVGAPGDDCKFQKNSVILSEGAARVEEPALSEVEGTPRMLMGPCRRKAFLRCGPGRENLADRYSLNATAFSGPPSQGGNTTRLSHPCKKD